MLLRALLAGVVIAVATAGASATAGLLELEELIQPVPGGGPAIPQVGLEPTRSGEPQTILLMGSDRRWKDTDDDPPRSDTLMLVRIDPDQQATTVLSIPRDLRVDIPGRGTRKINDAYGLGGPSLAMRTVKELTGLEINHAINVNFKGFRGVVNLFDCFYADIDRRYFHSNKGVPVGQRYDAIDLKPGYQRLCGNDALDYVRYRHTDSDITRSARQQDFLRAAKGPGVDELADRRSRRARARVLEGHADRRGPPQRVGLHPAGQARLGTADDPIRQIPFPAEFVRDDETKADYVVAAPATVQSAVEKFLTGGGPAARKPARASRRRGSVRAAELRRGAQPRAQGGRRPSAGREDSLGFPLRFPSHLTERGYFETPARVLLAARPRRTVHTAPIGLVLAETRSTGSPMVFRARPGARRCAGLAARSGRRRAARIELFRAGQRLRFGRLAHGPVPAYWISNTVGLKLSNDEMLALAASLTTK
jgi:LCP family protein required for cell wall assembly